MATINKELKKNKEQVIKYNFKEIVGDQLKNLEKVQFYKRLPVTSRPVSDFDLNRIGNKFQMEHHLKSGLGLDIFNKQYQESSRLY